MKPQVAVIMGSKSDREQMAEAENMLKSLGIEAEVKVLSAHRAPQATIEYALAAEGRGIKVIIAGAGGAAHLAGVLAAHTVLPVIGVPMATQHLQGIDSLLSIVQMPGGVPVAAMAIGKAGAKNAAVLAAQILALEDQGLRKRLAAFKKELADSV